MTATKKNNLQSNQNSKQEGDLPVTLVELRVLMSKWFPGGICFVIPEARPPPQSRFLKAIK